MREYVVVKYKHPQIFTFARARGEVTGNCAALTQKATDDNYLELANDVYFTSCYADAIALVKDITARFPGCEYLIARTSDVFQRPAGELTQLIMSDKGLLPA